MAYRLRNSFRNVFGVSIDDVVNSEEAKQEAIRQWKYQMQFRKVEAEWEEREYKKYEAWMETYLFSTLRHFKKYGDRFRIVQTIRPFAKWLTKNKPKKGQNATI